MKYYVDCKANKNGNGTKENPFATIQEAANVAVAGDEVFVASGIYREAVNPKNAGTAEHRITYRSEKPLGAVIKGSEELTGWQNVKGSIWTARVSNDIFTERNPYTTRVSGDWFIAFITAHVGDVYLNGKSMYEKSDMEAMERAELYEASWDPDFTRYTWFSEQDEKTNETVFFCNFQDKNPNEELVEIAVRPSCFYPKEEGIGYITLSGFTVTQAATQWAPPTAYQEGMIGPHWSKGWIIEDCDISESKCSGISLGKYKQKGNDNKWLKTKYKDGTQTERECILQAQYEGWSKERIGSHIVRRCNIHDCGQTGIVGHLGGVFSIIEDNHIHHINNKQNLAGAEIGGIKMHAAIDVIYRRNHIHHCTRGLWLDWQAQGTRVTQNLFHDNTLPNIKGVKNPSEEMLRGSGEDIFIEVSHGPTLLDHNIFLSARAVKVATQGVAMVHNFIAGSFVSIGIGTDNGAKTLSSPRYTPYHVPHQTEVAGFMTFLHGDMRFYNNIFVQQKVHPALKAQEKAIKAAPNGWDDGCMMVGTSGYNKYPTQEEWEKEFEGYCGMGSAPSDRYYMHLPVWAKGNAYFNGAKMWKKETDSIVDKEHKVTFALEEKDGQIVFTTNAYDFIPKDLGVEVNSNMLGMAFEPEERFENPDGTDIIFDSTTVGTALML